MIFGIVKVNGRFGYYYKVFNEQYLWLMPERSYPRTHSDLAYEHQYRLNL